MSYPFPWLCSLSFTMRDVARHVIMTTTMSHAIVKALASIYRPKPVVAVMYMSHQPTMFHVAALTPEYISTMEKAETINNLTQLCGGRREPVLVRRPVV